MTEKITPITGGCLCGAVRFEVRGPPDTVGICHCRKCQRWTGTAFAVGVRFSRAQFRLTKGEPRFYRSSAIMQRGFCADCGSPLVEYVATEKDADGVWLSLGNFDDPSAFTPEHHFGVESQLPWVLFEDGLPRYRCDEDPDLKSLLLSAPLHRRLRLRGKSLVVALSDR